MSAPRRATPAMWTSTSGRPPKARSSARRGPRTDAEGAFLAIGEGAALWLTEAGAAGTARVRAKMAEAVSLAALHGAVVARPGARPRRADRSLRRR